MPIRVRRKKRNDNKIDDRYLSGRERTWKDDYAERNDSKVRRSVIAIAVVVIVIIIILVASIVSMTVSSNGQQTQSIEAADTFAVSQVEQQQMSDSAKDFAEGFLFYTYCSDSDKSLDGKNHMLANMASNSDAYRTIQDLNQTAPIISSQSLYPVVSDPVLNNPTQAYAGSFTYTLDCAAMDVSDTDDDNPDGKFADRGWHMTLTFEQSKDTDSDDGDASSWMITSAQINRN